LGAAPVATAVDLEEKTRVERPLNGTWNLERRERRERSVFL